MRIKFLRVFILGVVMVCLFFGTAIGEEIWDDCGVTESDYRLAIKKTKAATRTLNEILRRVRSAPGTIFLHRESVREINEDYLEIIEIFSDAIELYPCGGEALIGRGISYQELAFLYSISNKFHVLDNRYDCDYFLSIGKIDVIEGCRLSSTACKNMKSMIYTVDCDRSFPEKAKYGTKGFYRLEKIKVNMRTSSSGIHEVKYYFVVKSGTFTVSLRELNEAQVNVYVDIEFTVYGNQVHSIEKRVELNSWDFVEKTRRVRKGETEVTGYYSSNVSGLSKIIVHVGNPAQESIR